FEKKIYIFGVHPLHNPKKLFEVYQPLVDHINKQLIDATIKLEASRNYSAYDKKLFSGYFDLSLPNPYQTIVAASKGYDIFGKMADDENFRGIFIVRKDSNIKKVDQIKGKTVSYPAPTALAATMMPQHFLHINGIDINKDIKNSYVGSQESSIMNVYLKKTIAGSTWPPPWIAFAKDHPKIASQLEVKWETKPLLNNGLVAKKDFPKELLSKISNIIFNLHTHKEGKEILKAMELSKYEKADFKTYDRVREFVKNFEQEIRAIRINK
ncbi:MAG: PhnD/SsuA/transferrin family substrate-binding protein, partial [Campylobacterota bacterium]|nr:PhnD/SsuA/transferrin family substrate-binding protein [Campylobacterota bacterium]